MLLIVVAGSCPRAHVVAATGASQFEFLEALVRAPGIDWGKTVFFHLDEYAGLPITHPASFRLYLWKRFVSKLPVPPRSFCWSWSADSRRPWRPAWPRPPPASAPARAP